MFKEKNLNSNQPIATTMVVIPQEEWLNLHEKLDKLAELVTKTVMPKTKIRSG